jgi:integrase
MHAIFATAVDEDRMVNRNPCRIEDAGKEESPERQTVPLPMVFALAKAVPVRYRALVLLATFADLRWGELAGLRRENIDLDACEVRIVETVAELDKGGLRAETPKSQVSRRTVAFPADLVLELRWHLERFAEDGPRGLVFVGPKGGRLPRSNFRKIWHKARESVELPDLHFHDLRHTGGTLSAATGASLKELMARLGHSSVRAALIYQHATRDRDRAIAEALGALVREVQQEPAKRQESSRNPASVRVRRSACGTYVARRRPGLRARCGGTSAIWALTWTGTRGAGEGNRTLMTSLEGCGPQSSYLPRPRSGHVCQSP